MMIGGVRPSAIRVEVARSFVVARCPKTLVDLPLAIALITAGLGATKALLVVQKVGYFKKHGQNVHSKDCRMNVLSTLEPGVI